MLLYPLTFEPIYQPKVWGGRRLEGLGRSLPGDGPIGESWEIADLAGTSPSGGGGGAARSIVAQGPLAGRSLQDLLRDCGADLMGSVPLAAGDSFPLLIKYLDAEENLSVQVHPSPAYAAAHPEAHLKSEAWYIVQASEDAVIYHGLVPGVTADALREAIESGRALTLLRRVPVQAGECYYLPSGTLHALGAGVLAAEVQTPSDTTFRVFDWGRTDRELHIEQALQCIDFLAPAPPLSEPHGRFRSGGLCIEAKARCEHFHIEAITAEPGVQQQIVLNQQPAIWMMLQGEAELQSPTDAFAPLQLTSGTTVLLPASLEDPQAIFRSQGRLLQISFANALAHLLA